jgi:hypothetical protein
LSLTVAKPFGSNAVQFRSELLPMYQSWKSAPPLFLEMTAPFSF